MKDLDLCNSQSDGCTKFWDDVKVESSGLRSGALEGLRLKAQPPQVSSHCGQPFTKLIHPKWN